MKKFIALLLIFVAPVISQGKVNYKLSEYFQSQLFNLNQSVIHSETSVRPAALEHWYLDQFSLRIRAQVGFEVEGFLAFQVVPEMELIWQRSSPEGYATFKP